MEDQICYFETSNGGVMRGRLPAFLGIAGILCLAYAGARQLSSWTIPLAGLILLVAYIHERRVLWCSEFTTSSRLVFARKFAATLLIQQVFAAIIFFLFFGVAAVFGGGRTSKTFGLHELMTLCLMAAAFAAAAWSKDRTGPTEPRSELEEVFAQIEELAASSIVMPAAVFQLASRVAEQKLGANGVLIEHCAGNEQSFHVRRVGYTALRYAKLREHPLFDVRGLVDKGLSDPHPWVRYDAVWAADVLGFDDEALRAKLAEIAGGVEPPSDDVSLPSSDALANAQVRAARLLKRLEEGAPA